MALDLIRDYKKTQQELKSIDKLKQENTSLKQTIDSLKQRVIDLQEQKLVKEKEVKARLAAEQTIPESYKYIDEESKTKITALEETIKTLTEEKEALQTKITEISDYIHQNKKRNEYAFDMANKMGSIRGEGFKEGEEDGTTS